MELSLSEQVFDKQKWIESYPIGFVFDVVFDVFTARLTTLPGDRIRFHITEGPYAGTETVKVAVSMIRSGVFAVSWVEASGATVVHIEDFERRVVHSYATLPNGRFLNLKGLIRLVSAGDDQ